MASFGRNLERWRFDWKCRGMEESEASGKIKLQGVEIVMVDKRIKFRDLGTTTQSNGMDGDACLGLYVTEK